jgi:TolB-like protein/tetratricopeptide (TPR) repeat protein
MTHGVTLAKTRLMIVLALPLLLAGCARKHAAGAGSRYPRTAIAVLPMENLSAGPLAYVAPGLHDELLTQLAKVAALSVRPRMSVMDYVRTTETMKEIAGELAVGTIVQGSVQVVRNRLRVSVQVIDPVTDVHLWDERYDRPLDDAFLVQSDIARRIVQAVGTTLTRAEADAIAAAPTANAEAYRLYLQGRVLLLVPGYLRPNVESAQRLFERALAFDPGFALVHAALSEAHGYMFRFGYDRSPTRAARQREEAAAALRLAPGLPRAHLAMGLAIAFAHKGALGDLPKALQEIQVAAEGMPGSAELWEVAGSLYQNMGDWRGLQSAFERAIALDPRNLDLITDLGGNSAWLQHHYEEAVAEITRALALAPGEAWLKVARAQLYMIWRGDLDSLRAVLESGPEDYGPLGDALRWRVQLKLWERSRDVLLALGPEPQKVIFESQEAYEPAFLYAGWAHQLLADTGAAHYAFRRALGQLDSASRSLPDDWRLHASRGLALAGLGQQADARREVDWLRSSAVGMGVPRAVSRRTTGAMILAQAGLTDAALAEIEPLLAGPSWTVSAAMLRVDPRWDPIRNDPRFQALLSKYAGR